MHSSPPHPHPFTLHTYAHYIDVGLTIADKPNITFTGRRTIVRIPTVKLAFIKSIKNAANVTVNDVIYAAIAGAVHRHRAAHKDPSILDPQSHTKVQTRALLPVALPRGEGDGHDAVRGLRNKWSFASVSMPIGVKGSLERLLAANETMSKLKNSPTVLVQNTVESLAGQLLPWATAKQVAFDTFVRHTFVFSNVPGPVRGPWLCLMCHPPTYLSIHPPTYPPTHLSARTWKFPLPGKACPSCTWCLPTCCHKSGPCR